ncbi:MAG: hypothetical protein V4438_03900 [Patescibacteria group bacterium]
MATRFDDLDPESKNVSLSLFAIDEALKAFDPYKRKWTMAEVLPIIEFAFRSDGRFTDEEINAIVFRLENIGGMRDMKKGWNSGL